MHQTSKTSLRSPKELKDVLKLAERRFPIWDEAVFVPAFSNASLARDVAMKALPALETIAGERTGLRVANPFRLDGRYLPALITTDGQSVLVRVSQNGRIWGMHCSTQNSLNKAVTGAWDLALSGEVFTGLNYTPGEKIWAHQCHPPYASGIESVITDPGRVRQIIDLREDLAAIHEKKIQAAIAARGWDIADGEEIDIDAAREVLKNSWDKLLRSSNTTINIDFHTGKTVVEHDEPVPEIPMGREALLIKGNVTIAVCGGGQDIDAVTYRNVLIYPPEDRCGLIITPLDEALAPDTSYKPIPLNMQAGDRLEVPFDDNLRPGCIYLEGHRDNGMLGNARFQFSEKTRLISYPCEFDYEKQDEVVLKTVAAAFGLTCQIAQPPENNPQRPFLNCDDPLTGIRFGLGASYRMYRALIAFPRMEPPSTFARITEGIKCNPQFVDLALCNQNHPKFSPGRCFEVHVERSRLGEFFRLVQRTLAAGEKGDATIKEGPFFTA